MKRAVVTTLLLALFVTGPSAAKTLEIYFIDVEGGQSTLLVTPAGQSLLIDAGYAGRGGRGGRGGGPGAPPGAPAGTPSGTPAVGAPTAPPFAEPGRDPARIMTVIREVGLDHLDYLLVTHFHPDHVGGVPELASLIRINTFIDYGAPLGLDRMTTGGFRNYEPVRAKALHIEAHPGDRLPLDGITADVVSAGGTVISKPLKGAGEMNPACTNLEDFVEDGTENFRSVGVMFRFGAFRFLDLGDLSGNTLTSIVCPRNLLGTASVYLIAHHGDYDTNVPALYAALRPRVAIMDNGVFRGGAPDAFKILTAAPLDLWQLHKSENPGTQNAPDAFIANVDDGVTAYSIRLSASDDGSFRVVNGRTGFTKTYARK